MTTKKILSTMFFPHEPRGNYECVTSLPRELIDDKGRALVKGVDDLFSGDENGIPAGSDILVKVLNAEGDRLLHRRLFTVIWSGKVFKTGTDLRGIEVSSYIYDYEFEAVGDWWSSSEVTPVEEGPIAGIGELERYVQGEGYEKWNPGKQTYDIHEIDAESKKDRVVATERDKDRAKAMAAGSEPLPVAA